LENDSVNLFSNQGGKDDRQKVIDACKAFACTPWVAVYVEATNHADLYLTSLENYNAKYKGRGRAIDAWNMSPKSREQYASDSAVKHIHIAFEARSWTW
jgi:hypothetical protein